MGTAVVEAIISDFKAVHTPATFHLNVHMEILKKSSLEHLIVLLQISNENLVHFCLIAMTMFKSYI